MPQLKLGKLPPKPHPKTLKLVDFLKPGLTLPRAWGWEYNVPAWGMMGNDEIGDCTCACAGHMVMEWTSRTYGLVVPSTQQIVQAYSDITGYPATGDNGAAITDVLAYWQSMGIADHKILAWAAIDHTNLDAVKQAVSVFGGIDIGFNVPQSAMDDFNAGRNWNNASDTNIVGGHSVPVMGSGSLGCTCITWAKRQSMSWDFFKTYCDEAYAIVTQDWLDETEKSPIFGLDLAALKALL